MKYTLSILTLALLFSVAVSAQIPQQYIWKITFIADSIGNAKITVQNRCRDTHEFKITGSNVPYLDFAVDKVTVGGVSTENVPVIVNTKGLSRRSYQGQVTLFCLTCSRDKSCSQSRDILNVTLNVVTKEQLANYRPSAEFGIDSPIAITSSGAMAKAAAGPATEAEIKKLLEDLSDSPAAGTGPGANAVSSCGVPTVRREMSKNGKDCKGECQKKQKEMRELEARVRAQTLSAEKLCLGLMQLENTTAFVEARARRAEKALESASDNGSDDRVLDSLRSEAENSRKDARVFREKVDSARRIVDKAKEDAFSAMQELDDATREFEECLKKHPGDCD